MARNVISLIGVLLMVANPAMGAYSVTLTGAGGESVITIPQVPLADQVFDLAVTVNGTDPYVCVYMAFITSSPAIVLRGTVGAVDLSGSGTRYNQDLYALDVFCEPDGLVSQPAFPGPSAPYGIGTIDLVHGIVGPSLVGYVSVKLLAGSGPGDYTLTNYPEPSYVNPWIPPGSGAAVTDLDFIDFLVPASTVTFRVLPEPAAGLLLSLGTVLRMRRRRPPP